MQMRFCPRCREDRKTVAFEPPIAICLICYGSIPGHEGLNLEQLRLKARRSRKSRRGVRRIDLLEQLEHAGNPTCARCKQEFPMEEFEFYGIICRKCGDAESNERSN